MNTKIIILLVLTVLFRNESSAQTSDVVYNTIMQINLNNYVNKPVDSFLNIIPQSYNYLKITGNIKNNKARYLCIQYPGGTDITIIPKNYVYMNRIDPNRVWNLTLFKKETSHYIQIRHHSFSGTEASSD